ncbi:NAD(+)/NADH kinase [Tuwongella immobilis]|uniref:NAD kinase n=1 Tax=Tuwongella immobilis TaxID=692036 RepID=A0A6C2YM64_9BACT|nr:NAD(+)/NADH kinase [Tuwongella immobilis]VIP02680.1 atp-nad kinase : NAD kinase OS=Pirellula staleyi (strain ATCC 27377 / DSM 6068 / ICPB 4128) GN=nadK PE=3 SV=1: NAD_kinase [Tuwongella immobilis]VTS02129.1 atp-nad kinase : NAD kinase OS=Pirellula staleyi (strain ATCC 27377 / DSM 6068 / ICPB 4128) GN=nadK PE=3 SV=1: NAD_kinase [Tuwongella immobilis]
MRFVMLGNATKPQVREEAARLREELPKFGELVLVDLEQTHNLATVQADVAFVLGGDGAILRAVRQMAHHQIPVLGINLGRLGFLADVAVDEISTILPSIARGEFRITQHLMFECRVSMPDGFHSHLVLNDVVVRSGPPFHMINLEVAANDETVMRFLGDGLILSTPIGSTAHSLSAGGPILGQEMAAIVVTPISPHTLTTRPLVESADKVFRIQTHQSDGAWLSLDGQEHFPLLRDQYIEVRRASVQFMRVNVPGKNYYRTLREKLRWGTPPQYRTELSPPAERISE